MFLHIKNTTKCQRNSDSICEGNGKVTIWFRNILQAEWRSGGESRGKKEIGMGKA